MTPGKSYNIRNTSAYIKIQTPKADGPPITLKQKLEMAYSFTFYTALYISIVTLCIVSFGVEQVDRSVMHFFLWQISVNFFIILS